jgi:uncharacterized protein (TIGR03118 family)
MRAVQGGAPVLRLDRAASTSKGRLSMRGYVTSLAAMLASLFALAVAIAPAASAQESSDYLQTNLVSNVPGLARVLDANLKNPWGLVHSSTSPWWISDNNAGVTTVYTGDGTQVPAPPPAPPGTPLVVMIPPPGGSPAGTLGAPTGTVFNATSDFQVSKNGVSAPALFLFATEDGTIAGWSPSVDRNTAILAVDNTNTNTGPVYKGLAIGQDDGRNLLFAANFRVGTVDVFDANFTQVKRPRAFVDASIPSGFAPFGIQNIGGQLYVTYAKQNDSKHDDLKGPGNGFVDVFSTDGRLLRRLLKRGALNSPWGLALAPENFGAFSESLLVGNFGDGRINAYDRQSGRFRGTLSDAHGTPIAIEGLWGIAFGNGAAAGPRNTLFFTAGIHDETDGLFGTLTSMDDDT